jgi:hypothetical protein
MSDPNPKVGDEVTIVDDVVPYEGLEVDLKNIAGFNGVIEAIDQRRGDSVPLYRIKMMGPSFVEFFASREMFKPVERVGRVTRTFSEIAQHGVPSQYEDDEKQKRERKYLPTLSDLCDRLSIVLMKEIFIKDHRNIYRTEQKAIMHDIDLILAERDPIRADQIRALFVLQLANRFIWERESTIRDDSTKESPEAQLGHLRATHSVNGVRNTAKNALAAFDGGRLDYKVDALAAELPPEHGNWRVFEK